MPPVVWHPRQLVQAMEWLVSVPGEPSPVAVIRRLRIADREHFRAVTWAATSDGRELIGYYQSGDAAAEACWRHFCDVKAAQHGRAARTHGSVGRGVPRMLTAE